MRLFIGLPISENTRQKLLEVQRNSLQNVDSANPTPIQNLHLTLAFLGDTEALKLDTIKLMLNNVLRNQHSFDVLIERTDAFSKRNEFTVYADIDIGKKWLMELALSIRNGLKDANIPFEEDSYNPHITLARRVRYLSKTPSFKIEKLDINETIHQVCLYESTRVDGILTYIPLIIIPLNQSL